MHGLRHPVLQQRLPPRQPHPRLERPRPQGPLARRDRPVARHQQLPRVHRSALPGSLRGGVRARHQPGPGDHQAGRGVHHRPSLGRGLGRARAPVGAHRQVGRGRRIGAGGPRRRTAAHARGASGGRPRARRPHRGPAPLRHPRVQDGEAPPRSPTGADGGGGDRAPAGRERGRRHHRRRAARRVRRGGAGGWRDRRTRPSRARSRPRRDPPGHGVPALVEPGAGGGPAPRRGADQRTRQGRHHHRWR